MSGLSRDANDYASGKGSQPMRRFSGIVWLDDAQERSSLLAPSWDEAVALLKEQYGTDREFTLTDEEAATRPR